MASNWYYSQNGNQHGPVSSSELKQLAVSGKLQPSDLVWKEGQKPSLLAARVKGLFPASTMNPSPKPPALPPNKPAPSRPFQPPPSVPESSASKKRTLIIGLSGGAILIVLLAVVIIFVSGDGNDEYSTGSSEAEAPTNEVAAKFVKTSYEPPVFVPPFDTVDYNQGPNGEPLQKREKTNEEGMIVRSHYFVDSSGKETNHGVSVTRTPEGQYIWEMFGRAGVAHGISREWYPDNGQLAVRGMYLEGNKHGKWEYWYEDGTPSLIEHWNEELQDGVATVFYENGRKKIQVEWRDGEKTGRFYQWYESGNLQESGSYVDGVKEQVWIGWYENEAKSFVENWKEGGLVGRELRWSEDGDIIFDKDWSERSDEYINGYRGQWSLGRRMGEKYRNANSDSDRAYFMRGFQESLAQWEESRDDLIRQFGANYPEAQKLLGLCDGYQDGFESAQTE